jgi:hypothetical protein
MSVMNVRSVEQNAYPALLLFPAALISFSARQALGHKVLAISLSLASLLGAYGIWSFGGRLGWVALLASMLPSLLIVTLRVFGCLGRRWKIVAGASFLTLICLSLLSVLRLLSGYSGLGQWSQGLCEERFSIYSAMLSHLSQSPWGGRLLKASYENCSGSVISFSVEPGGTALAHNVFLDIYFNVGFLPLIFLSAALLPCLFVVMQSIPLGLRRLDLHFAVRWGWLVFLACQWMFNPLLYSDGILYYLTFFLMGTAVSPLSRGPVSLGYAPCLWHA